MQNAQLFSITRSWYRHVFTGASQTMQEIMWQVAIKFGVLHIRNCLSLLLDYTAADSDSDLTPNQPLTWLR